MTCKAEQIRCSLQQLGRVACVRRRCAEDGILQFYLYIPQPSADTKFSSVLCYTAPAFAVCQGHREFVNAISYMRY